MKKMDHPIHIVKTKMLIVWDYGKDFSCYHLPFVWDYSDFGSYHLSFYSYYSKLFCVGDRNDHYQRNPTLGMVATKVILVKIFCDGGF